MTEPVEQPMPLTAVLAALDLEQTDEDTFVGASLPQLHGRVYGGQVLAQALLAAGRTMAPERLPHSVHGYFLRPGALDEPITFAVERLRDGRSFSARRTHAVQSGKPILSMIASFQENQPGLEHADAMPEVPGPESLPSSVELFGSLDHPVAQFFYRNGAFDMRHTDGNLFTGPAEERTDRQQLWMRARGPIPGGQLHHRAMLAYACDQVMLEPIMRRHGLSWMSREASVASLDHAMWWHRDVDAGEWLLFVQSSPSARGGRGLGEAKVFDRAGALVATIAQEGMLRVPERG
ncbi:acyl-CoA thioesterase II [Ruania suaedae]|uniref:acyl-CoA thioesterase n=1 Tax=Ruania suaedae TaxID=2897774 RepID=UPI001E47EEE0|nr:acyl-CoA thioesterase II [Ruania suaedae]UFU04063.1 acyl-CoA thioesterase II [Ruania suaedae]